MKLIKLCQVYSADAQYKSRTICIDSDYIMALCYYDELYLDGYGWEDCTEVLLKDKMFGKTSLIVRGRVDIIADRINESS